MRDKSSEQSEIGKQLSDLFKVHFRNADTNGEWRSSAMPYKTEADAIEGAKQIGKAWNVAGLLYTPAAKGGTEWQIVRHTRVVITEGSNP